MSGNPTTTHIQSRSFTKCRICNFGSVMQCVQYCVISDCTVKNKVFKRGVPFRVRPCRVCVCHLGVIRCKDICRYRNLECPSVQEVTAANATCGTTCTSDYYCKFGQKCCSNGCGKKCVEPLGMYVCSQDAFSCCFFFSNWSLLHVDQQSFFFRFHFDHLNVCNSNGQLWHRTNLKHC